jgi:hypothetical protein
MMNHIMKSIVINNDKNSHIVDSTSPNFDPICTLHVAHEEEVIRVNNLNLLPPSSSSSSLQQQQQQQRLLLLIIYPNFVFIYLPVIHYI